MSAYGLSPLRMDRPSYTTVLTHNRAGLSLRGRRWTLRAMFAPARF